MREVKFRAWIPQAKEWIENVDLKDLWQSGRAFEDHGTSRYEAENIQGISWKFDDLIFMQFVRRFDSGRPIYESDIVYCADYGVKGVVTWVDFHAGFVILDKDKITYTLHDHWEVIGNIYENPELIPQAH